MIKEFGNKVAIIVIGIVAITALFFIGADAKEIAIAGIAAIGGAMQAK